MRVVKNISMKQSDGSDFPSPRGLIPFKLSECCSSFLDAVSSTGLSIMECGNLFELGKKLATFQSLEEFELDDQEIKLLRKAFDVGPGGTAIIVWQCVQALKSATGETVAEKK